MGLCSLYDIFASDIYIASITRKNEWVHLDRSSAASSNTKKLDYELKREFPLWEAGLWLKLPR